MSLLQTLLDASDNSNSFVVQVSIVEGKNLDVKDTFASDPYVVAQLNDQIYETRVVKNTVNPVWNQTFSFTPSFDRCKKPDKDEILIRCFDRDLLGKDDELGHFELKLNTMKLDDTVDSWFKLLDCNGGEIHVQITTYPMSELRKSRESLLYFWEVVDMYNNSELRLDSPSISGNRQGNSVTVTGIDPCEGSYEGNVLVVLTGQFDIYDPNIQVRFDNHFSKTITKITPTTIECISPSLSEKEFLKNNGSVEVIVCSSTKDSSRPIDNGPATKTQPTYDQNTINRSKLSQKLLSCNLDKFIKAYLKAGKDALFEVDSFGRNVAHLAFTEGRFEVVKFILEEMRPNVILACKLLFTEDVYHNIPIVLAKLNRKNKFLKELKEYRSLYMNESRNKRLSKKSLESLKAMNNSIAMDQKKTPSKRVELRERLKSATGSTKTLLTSFKSMISSHSLVSTTGDTVVNEGGAWSTWIEANYVDNNKHDQTFTNSLGATNNDSRLNLIQEHLQSITRSYSDHPLSLLLQKFTLEFESRNTVQQDTAWISIEKNTNDLKMFAKKLSIFLVNKWKNIDVITGQAVVYKQLVPICASYAFDTLMNSLYLQIVLKRTVDQLMELSNISLQDLEPEPCLLLNGIEDPYSEAISRMTSLHNIKNPEVGLQAISLTCKEICDQADEHWTDRSNIPVDCWSDKLLPVFLYVLVKSGMQKLCLHLHFVEDFTDQDKWDKIDVYSVNMFKKAIEWALSFAPQPDNVV
ncbi:ADP-ribosylation factor GTPase-activating protein [Acrasis kona]|uniref:ADP-ribosylation factor GTPase-activating protein n=1 Tax=Acrasis kona TaxID=1008807 RepID=A0AAW2Z590_9EUKA